MTLPSAPRLLSTPWFRTPGSTEPGVQIFAIGDVHGRADAFSAALDAIAQTPRQAQQRILVLLGNLVGKGPNSFSCIDLAMGARQEAQIDELVALPGNHEIMMAQALLDPEFMLESWALSGGQAVLNEAGVGEMGDSPLLQAEGVEVWLPLGWAEGVMAAQGWWQNGDFLFVHAGIHPTHDRRAFLNQPPASSVANHWAWMREPFLSWTKGWDADKRTVVVHGHTPALTHWVGTDADLASLVPLERQRLCLDAGAQGREQVAWAELRGNKARVHCVQYGRGEAF